MSSHTPATRGQLKPPFPNGVFLMRLDSKSQSSQWAWPRAFLQRRLNITLRFCPALDARVGCRCGAVRHAAMQQSSNAWLSKGFTPKQGGWDSGFRGLKAERFS